MKIRIGILSLLILQSFFLQMNCFSQNSEIDSLREILKKTLSDTNKVKTLNEISDRLRDKNDYDNAVRFADSALRISETRNYNKGIANSYYNVALALNNKGNFDKALGNFYDALKYFEKIDDKSKMANAYEKIGIIQGYKYEYDEALRLFSKAVDLYQSQSNRKGIAKTYGDVGMIYNYEKNYDKAIEYFEKTISISNEIGSTEALAAAYNHLGNIYTDKGDFEKALTYYNKALKIEETTKNKYSICYSYISIGYLYTAQMKKITSIEGKRSLAKKAEKELLKGLSLAVENKDKINILNAYQVLADCYASEMDFKNAYDQYQHYTMLKDTLLNEKNNEQMKEMQAKYETEKKDRELFEKDTEITKQQIDAKQKSFQRNAFIVGFGLMILLALFIFRNYRQKGKVSEAMIKQNEIIAEKNKVLERLSIVASETENVILIMDADGTLEWVNESFVKLNAITLEELKKLKGNTIYEISNNPDIRKIIEGSIRKKKPVVYESLNKTIDGKVIWESSTLTPIFDKNDALKKLIIIDTDITDRKNAEQIISQKNKDITDSINYAQKIQQAILPDVNEFENHFPDSFVLFKPKDIVSGDFYWINKKKDLVFFAAADCTGHGVPGGFMSMLGNSFLNEIINEKAVLDPADVLDLLRIKIINSLKQKGESGENKDGMDMCLCRIDKKKNELVYAAANNPLWLIRNNELQEYKADKQPVGISGSEILQFNQQTVGLQAGDCIYIFTDGYADQFGGENGKKFKYKQLKELLLANIHLTMNEQKKILSDTIEKWKGDLEQVDDILLIGIKI